MHVVNKSKAPIYNLGPNMIPPGGAGEVSAEMEAHPWLANAIDSGHVEKVSPQDAVRANAALLEAQRSKDDDDGNGANAPAAGSRKQSGGRAGG
ncbi:MAG: hypothetical protein LBV73_27300 [Paraburkholderia sp.]|jgi:hypothetical protein|nr:hypothetical protein [Paraburkholderia sp.]